MRPSRFFVPGRVGRRAELAAQARPYDLFFGSGRHNVEDGPMGHDRPDTIELSGGGQTHRRRRQRSVPRASRGWLPTPPCGRAGGRRAPSGVRRLRADAGDRDWSSGPAAERHWPPRPELRPPRAANVGGRRGRSTSVEAGAAGGIGRSRNGIEMGGDATGLGGAPGEISR
jgi:hypothetical protein